MSVNTDLKPCKQPIKHLLPSPVTPERFIPSNPVVQPTFDAYLEQALQH